MSERNKEKDNLQGGANLPNDDNLQYFDNAFGEDVDNSTGSPDFFDFGDNSFEEPEVSKPKEKPNVSSTGFTGVEPVAQVQEDTYEQEVPVETEGKKRNGILNKKRSKEEQDTLNSQPQIEETEEVNFFADNGIDLDTDGESFSDVNLDDGGTDETKGKKPKDDKKRGKLKPFIIAGGALVGVGLASAIAVNMMYLGDRPSDKGDKPTQQETPTDNSLTKNPQVITTDGEVADPQQERLEKEKEQAKEDKFLNGTTEVLEGEENVVKDGKNDSKRNYVDYSNTYLGFTTKYLGTWVKEETTQEYLNIVTKATKKNKQFNIKKNKLKKGVRTVDIKASDFKDTQRIITVWVYPSTAKQSKGETFIYDKTLYDVTKEITGKKVGKRINAIKTAELKTVFKSYGEKYEGYQSTIKVGQNTVIITATGLYNKDINKDMKANFATVVKSIKFNVIEVEKKKKKEKLEAKKRAKAEKTKESSDSEVQEDNLDGHNPEEVKEKEQPKEDTK